MHSVLLHAFCYCANTVNLNCANGAPQGITQLNPHAQPCWHSTVNSLVLALFGSIHQASVKETALELCSLEESACINACHAVGFLQYPEEFLKSLFVISSSHFAHLGKVCCANAYTVKPDLLQYIP